jgi:DNA-binding NarL/FixJ family response regulator
MIKILIADDHAIVRAGLRKFLAGVSDMQIAGEAGSSEEVLAQVREAEWNVVLLDLALPDRSGVDTLRLIRQMKPVLPVLILSVYPEDQYAINLLRSGASGYIVKETEPEELIRAIRMVAAGRKYVSASLAQLLASELNGADGPLHNELSEREFQVFCKLAAGMSVSQIATELFLSVKTISTYRRRILEKMNMKSNADCTYYAIKNGLIE